MNEFDPSRSGRVADLSGDPQCVPSDVPRDHRENRRSQYEARSHSRETRKHESADEHHPAAIDEQARLPREAGREETDAEDAADERWKRDRDHEGYDDRGGQ
ncbi:hypothetical protein GCM10009039_25790 [Halocalculus aciditolerans]|uniref:Uncharacterized protein n=1 Tax=Halocalculus aciditolerans TaxID=1383812 RepID=A0A830F628_9EURY|nr:hypothetical protein GCM10009039_25790 [Halocalculus aciditolerans]